MKLRCYLLLFFIYLYPRVISAQSLSDWQARPSLSINYKVTPKFEVGSTYYLYLHDHLSKFKGSEISAELTYKFTPVVAAGMEYRYGFAKEISYHDLRYSIAFTPPINHHKWDFKFRPLLQVKVDPAHNNYTEYIGRFNFKAGYLISERWKVFLFTEPYFDLKQQFSYLSQKTGLGVEIEISKNGVLKPQVTLRNKRDYESYGRIELNYQIKI